MEVFAEQLEIVHGLWTSDDFSFAGEHYRLTGVDALPKPVQRPHPPLIVGGMAKPADGQLAARWADEYNTVFAGPQECRERRAAVAAAWAAAGPRPRHPRLLADDRRASPAATRPRSPAAPGACRTSTA